MTSVESLVAHLGTATGAGVRPASAADAVAAVAAGVVVAPESEQQVAAALALADAEGLNVVVRGGGTQMRLGYPPRAADIVLCTTNLGDVVEYNPHDLTITVQAGMRLVDLQQVLGASRQFLALDPALSPEATIGGLIATNATGPLRLRYGGVRDQIIGVRVVTADGTIAKGGGKVVKNVAGYDLPKLFTGSLGTLGVIVAASFRLYPLPAASRTVVITGPAPSQLCDLAQRVLASSLEPVALCVGGIAGEPTSVAMAVRFHSVADAVAEQATRLGELAGEAGISARSLTDDDESAFWQERQQAMRPDKSRTGTMLLKVSVLPTDVEHWIERLTGVATQLGLSARYDAQAGHGLIFAELSGSDEAMVATVEPLREAAGPLPERGSMVVWDAPPAVAAHVDVWGPSPALALMRQIKHSFDPNATLNPGRFIGRI